MIIKFYKLLSFYVKSLNNYFCLFFIKINIVGILSFIIPHIVEIIKDKNGMIIWKNRPLKLTHIGCQNMTKTYKALLFDR